MFHNYLGALHIVKLLQTKTYTNLGLRIKLRNSKITIILEWSDNVSKTEVHNTQEISNSLKIYDVHIYTLLKM